MIIHYLHYTRVQQCNVDVINVETNIMNVAIRIMRDGVRVFTKGSCDHP